MNDGLIVNAGERGVVRVFSASIEAGGIKAFEAPGAIDAALGVSGIDPEYVEVFAITDLAGIGLATYLIDGCGVADAVIEPDRQRLDAMTGHVMAVRSRAFGGVAQVLEPAPQLRLVGIYSETPVDWTPGPAIETESARPGSGHRATPRDRRVNTRRTGAAVFAFCTVVILVFLALVVF